MNPGEKIYAGVRAMKKSREEINAFLGEDTDFEGKFSFTGAVRIDGKFSGEIQSSGTLIIGESAIIKAQIHIADIIISGEVHGDIFAENKIEIGVPGKLFGNIQTPKLVIEEGVIFEGKCKMKELGKPPDKTVVKPSAEKESLSAAE
jgi:cytoskeletal protein CcmA (bactofilin family)